MGRKRMPSVGGGFCSVFVYWPALSLNLQSEQGLLGLLKPDEIKLLQTKLFPQKYLDHWWWELARGCLMLEISWSVKCFLNCSFISSQCPVAYSLAGRVFDFYILCCVPCFSRGDETWSHVISKHFQGVRLCLGQQAAPLCKQSLQVQNTTILEMAVTLSGLIAIIWVKSLVPQTL